MEVVTRFNVEVGGVKSFIRSAGSKRGFPEYVSVTMIPSDPWNILPPPLPPGLSPSPNSGGRSA